MKKYLLLSILIVCIITLGSFRNLEKNAQEDPCAMLNYFLQLKEKTANKYWTDFNKQVLYGPMMYYGINGTYVINSNAVLNSKIKVNRIDGCLKELTISQTSEIIDSSRLNMQVDYGEDDSTLLYYKNAIASVSDINIARKYVSNLTDTEFWISMVIHESFHLYQTSHPAFKACQNETQELFQRDTLISFYKNLEWYKNGIAKEDELISKATISNNKDSIKYFIKDYLDNKKNRQQRIAKEYNINIASLEDMLERSEGVARYIEYCMKRTVKEMPRQVMIEQIDTSYHFGAYNNYERKNDDVMNGIGKQYYYATGFNLAILFEKLKVNYQTTMYKDNRTFDWYLNKII